jgi:hypothetical protein
MKPKYFQVFKVNSDGTLTRSQPHVPKPTLEECESQIVIPDGYVGAVWYTILPIYTNVEPSRTARSRR